MEFSRFPLILKQYKNLFITLTLLVGLLALVGSLVLRVVKPVFVSSCLILVYPSEEDRALLKEQSAFGGGGDPETITLSRTEIILSRTVLGRVAEKLAAESSGEETTSNFMTRAAGALAKGVSKTLSFLNYGPSREVTPIEERIFKLKRKIGVNIFPNTFVVELSARSDSSESAYRIVSATAETYVDYTRTFNHELASEFRRFIEAEVKQLEVELFAAEDALQQFEEEESMPALVAQGGQLISTESEYQRQRNEIWTSLQELEAERDAIRDQLKIVDKEVSSRMVELNPNLQQMRYDLSEQEAEYASLLEIFTPEHQKVKSVESKMEKLRETISLETEKILTQEQISVNPVYSELSNRLTKVETLLVSQQARLGAMDEVMDQFSVRLAELPAMEIQLDRLTRRVGTLRSTNTLLQKSLGEARLLEAAKLYDIRIVEPPTRPVRCTSPAILANTLLGLIVGFLLAIGATILIEYNRTLQ